MGEDKEGLFIPGKSKNPTPPSTNQPPLVKKFSSPQKTQSSPKPKIPPRRKEKVAYNYAGGKNLFQLLQESLPKGAHPTAKTPKILGAIFLIVVVIGVLQFPLFGAFSGNTKITARIGIPWTFLEFKLFAPEENPIRIGNLILDLILYIFLAYLVDIAINTIINMKLLKSEEEKKSMPQMWEDKGANPTFAERVTRKVFKK